MSTTSICPKTADPGQRLVINRLGWKEYVAISDAIGDRPGLRLIYLDGSLELLIASRRHIWYAEKLGMLVTFVAQGCGLNQEHAGRSTFRREDLNAAVEGDKTFYFGSHAELLRGPVEIDLTRQPPPDLAIEVEVSHSAERVMAVWGQFGVPEFWRCDPDHDRLTFLARQENGTYAPIERSLSLPVLTSADVLDQFHQAEVLGSSKWFQQLPDWVRDVLRPRLGEGG